MTTVRDRKRTTVRTLLISASMRLCIALAVGVLFALPFLAPSVPFEFEQNYAFSSLPGTDESLTGWLRDHSNVSEVEAVRSAEGKLDVRFTRRGVRADSLHPPLRDFGYEGMKGGQFSSRINYALMLQEPFFALVFLLSGQFGFLVVGIWWFRSARTKAPALPAVLEGSLRRAIGCGILLGFFLLAIGFGYDALLGALPVKHPDTAGVWRAVTDLPIGPLLTVLAIGCVVAPFCEELFFRGALFGSFSAANVPVGGGVFSALLFAIVHFDPISFIPLFIFGLATAWAYHRTRSLVTTIIAHALNNTVAFTLILW